MDRIFDELLPAEIEEAKSQGSKARLMFYAHGGLVSEANALAGAFQQLKFWRAQRRIPNFLHLGDGSRRNGPADGQRRGGADHRRARIADGGHRYRHRRNRSRAARRPDLGGDEHSAEMASTPPGGAAYVATRAAALLAANSDALEVHTVGTARGRYSTHVSCRCSSVREPA